jgi:hypothetical protein
MRIWASHAWHPLGDREAASRVLVAGSRRRVHRFH